MKIYLNLLIQGDNSTCSKPPGSALAWLVLAWAGQNGTFVLKSTGGFEQVELSPCTCGDATLVESMYSQFTRGKVVPKLSANPFVQKSRLQ